MILSRVTTERCGATAGEYTCTLLPHTDAIDHADQVIPADCPQAAYTRAFWSTRTGGEPVVVDPYKETYR